MSLKRPKKNLNSSRKSTKSLKDSLAIDSHRGELCLSRVEIKVSVKKQKIALYNNPKNLLPIYAYQAQSLKKCLIQNPKMMRQFFHTQGKCQHNGWKQQLYSKPFLTYFRQWRKDLRERLMHIIVAVTDNKRTFNDEETQKMLHQIQYIVEELKQANKQIIQHSRNQEKPTKQSKRFQQNFQHTEQYIKHLINLIRYLSQCQRQINKMLHQISINDQTTENIISSETQKGIKDLHIKYQKLIFSSFSFCTSHPESAFMNKSEYRIKKRFDSIFQSVTKIALRILRLKTQRNLIKAKLSNISNNAHISPSVQELEQISAIIEPYKHKGTPSSQHLINSQSNDAEKIKQNTGVSFQIEDSFPAHPIITELQGEIVERINEFLNIFQLQSAFIIENQFEGLRDYRLGDCFEEKSREDKFRLNKKKLLLIANIFNRSPFLGYFGILSSFIKQNSKEYQDISQVIKSVFDKGQSKKLDQQSVYIPKIIKHLLQFALKFEEKQDLICSAMFQKFSIQSQRSSLKPRQSQQLQRFLKALDFQTNHSSKLHRLLLVPKYLDEKPNRTITDQQMQKLVQSNNNDINKIMTQILPNLTTNSQQQARFNQNSLIDKFISKESGESKKTPDPITDNPNTDNLDIWLSVIQQFHRHIYHSKHQNREITQQSVMNMIQYLEESIKKCSNLCATKEVIQFLEWIFQNRVCLYLISKMSNINSIVGYADNKKFISKSEKVVKNKLAYRWNSQLQKRMQRQKQLFKMIIENASKHINQKSIFDYYFNQSLNTLITFIQIQDLYEAYDLTENNEFKMSARQLQNWLGLEFHYCISKSITDLQIRLTRKNVKQVLEKYIENCFKIITQNRLSPNFIGCLKNNISDLTNLLQLTKPKLIQGNLLQNYLKIIQTMITYMRNQKYFHLGFFSKDGKPLTFICENYENNFDSIVEGLVSNIVPQKQKNNGQRISQIQILISSFVELQEKEQKSKYLRAQPSLQLEKQYQSKHEAKVTKKQPNMFLLDEIKDQIPEQQIGQEHNNEPCFILTENPKPKTHATFQSDNFCDYYPIPSVYHQHFHYMFRQIASTAFLQSILKEPAKTKKLMMSNNIGEISFAPDTTQQNNQKQFHKVKQFIKVQKLAQLLEDELPGEEHKIRIVEHLEEALGMISGFRVVEKNSDNLELWTLFNCISNLKQAINLCNNDQKTTHFAQLLKTLSIECDCIYSDAPKLNNIFLLTSSSSLHSQSSQYCHLSLKNPHPFHSLPDLLPDTYFIKVEQQYFDFLLKNPEEQELGELTIRQEIEGLNEVVMKGYEELKKLLGKWKSYGIENNEQCEKKVREYLDGVTGNRKFGNWEIGYEGYGKLIQEYQVIIKGSNEYQQFYYVQIDGDQNQPIFISRNNQQINQFIVKYFQIFSDHLNQYAHQQQQYITAKSKSTTTVATKTKTQNNVVDINMQKLIQRILQSIASFENVEIGEVSGLIYGTYELTPQMSVFNKKKQMDNFYPTQIIRQYQAISTIYRVIGKMSELEGKISQISYQKQILEKLSEFHAKQVCFILSDTWREKQKQGSLLSKPSFLLSDTLTRTEFKSYQLAELYQLFIKAHIKCKFIKYNGEIIAIVDQGMQVWEGLARIGVQNYGRLEWKEQISSSHSNTGQILDVVEIKELFIEIGVGNLIEKSFAQPRKKVSRILKNFLVKIQNDQKTSPTLSNLHCSSFTKIKCKYPRRSIQVKLVQLLSSSSVEKQHFSFIIKHYSYGSKYTLDAIEAYLVQFIEMELKKDLETEEMVMSQSLGGVIRGIDVKELLDGRMRNKFQEKKDSIEDESLQISIVLTQNGQGLKEHIKQMIQSERSKLKFDNVENMVEQRRKRAKIQKTSKFN